MALIFRQLVDPQSATYTYLVACGKNREAILIDPVFEQVRRDSALTAHAFVAWSRATTHTTTMNDAVA